MPQRDGSKLISSQSFGYRRGFVLGLTLAEAALLLIFVILLLMVAGFERRDRALMDVQPLLSAAAAVAPVGADPIIFAQDQIFMLAQISEAIDNTEYERIEDLVELVSNVAVASRGRDLVDELVMLAEVRDEVEGAGHEWNEDFIELVRAVSVASIGSDLVDASRALQEKQERLDRMLEVLGELESAEEVQELLERVADSDARLSNQQGQLIALREQLERSGQGGVLPSCWTTPEGRIDYILDVVLESGGIRIQESFPDRRRDERGRLPMDAIATGRTYSQLEFQALTKGVYDWSVDRECRFYVSIFDGTKDHEKERYKSLLTTVEGHFYKRLSNNAPPF